MKLLRKFLFVFAFFNIASAQEFPKDVFIKNGDLFPSEKNVLVNKKTRLYLTIRNNSTEDLTGIARFFDVTENKKIGTDKDFFTIAGRSNDIFVDFIPKTKGDHTITAEIIPWEKELDNPNNNHINTKILVEEDLDKDGILDSLDDDRDGDRIKNELDAFPENRYESVDVDQDGIGNNTDKDDDNDGIPDEVEIQMGTNPLRADTDNDGVQDNLDAFPNDEKESKDFDQDGLGDNADLDDDNDGIKDEDDANSVNPAPTIIADFPERARVGEFVTFSAQHSFDKNGEIKKVEWFFHDETLQGTSVKKIFQEAGTYKVNVKVTDNDNEDRRKAIFIHIQPQWTFFEIGLLLLGCCFLGLGIKFHLDRKKCRG